MSSFSSLSQDDNTTTAEMEKWQKMYDENALTITGIQNNIDKKTSSKQNSSRICSSSSGSEIRIVTFDLDNTIWKTSNVIQSANDALATYLETELNLNVPLRVEKIMGQLFQQNKGKYSPILLQDVMNEYSNDDDDDDDDDDHVEKEENVQSPLEKIKSPVLLTQLRIDALMEVFNNQTDDFHNENHDENNDTTTTTTQNINNIQSKAQEAFTIWTNARHNAIPQNLASSGTGVLQCLQEIRQLQTSYGQNIVVGAITDGNSDPRNVDMLKEYFDFCINAESVGISKPDRRVYDAAMKLVYKDDDLKHIFHGMDDLLNDDDNDDFDDDDIDCDVLFDKMQDKWIHVGDDFMKDIVGAKELKMRSVWCRELIKGKEQSMPTTTTATTTTTNNEPSSSSSNLKKDLDEKKVVKMIIGTDDFLMNSIHDEFADAIVDEFREVSKVLSDWHLEGIEHNNQKNVMENDDISSGGDVVVDDVVISQEVKDLFEVIVPNEKESSTVEEGETKFCIMCATKLPKVAKFCSSCGSKQS